MATLKVTRIGDSVGVILPKNVVARLKLAEGDRLSYTETANGIELMPCRQGFEEKLTVARKTSRRDRNAIKELAK